MNPEDITTVEDLKLQMEKGFIPKFVFFWGHTPKIPGIVDQSCLSNWYPSSFTIDNVEYPTSEHYLMAEKANIFNDQKIRSEILKASNPGVAKNLGRSVDGFEEEIWIIKRFEVMVRGCFAKFSQNQALADVLLRTGTKILVEASPKDRVWGIGMAKDNQNAEDPRKWNGLNLLGFVLMNVRQRLKKL